MEQPKEIYIVFSTDKSYLVALDDKIQARFLASKLDFEYECVELNKIPNY